MNALKLAILLKQGWPMSKANFKYKEHTIFNIESEPCDFDNGKYKWWLVKAPRQTKDKTYRKRTKYALWYVSDGTNKKYLLCKYKPNNTEIVKDFDSFEAGAIFMDIQEHVK